MLIIDRERMERMDLVGRRFIAAANLWDDTAEMRFM